MSLSVLKELTMKWLKNSLTAFNIAMTPIMIVLSVVAYTITESENPVGVMNESWLPLSLYLTLFVILVFLQRLYPILEDFLKLTVDKYRYQNEEVAIRIRGAELRLDQIDKVAKEGKLE